jgi:hypothetical protein
MTEQQWLACGEPEKLLEALRGKASHRKLRLFLVACARRVLPASPDEDMAAALAAAERFADGAESRHRLARVRAALQARHPARVGGWSPLYTEHVRSVPAWHAAREKVGRAAREGARCCAWSSTRSVSPGGFLTMPHPSEELAAQAALLRDILGSPFRPITLDPACLLPQVIALAQAAYDQRELPAGHLDLARLAVLADALEEAGCTDPDLLGHLRGPGPHVRGSWAVDLLLGKS